MSSVFKTTLALAGIGLAHGCSDSGVMAAGQCISALTTPTSPTSVSSDGIAQYMKSYCTYSQSLVECVSKNGCCEQTDLKSAVDTADSAYQTALNTYKQLGSIGDNIEDCSLQCTNSAPDNSSPDNSSPDKSSPDNSSPDTSLSACKSNEGVCKGDGFKSGFNACHSCSEDDTPKDCAHFIKLIGADGCYGACSYGMTEKNLKEHFESLSCTDKEQKDAEKAIEAAEAAQKDVATTAGLSVAAACALAVASLYHM